MNEKVNKFSLKRRKQLEHTIFTDGKLYDVYRNEDPRSCDRWGFFIIDNNYTKHYFNMINGQINNVTSQLVADYWEVVRQNQQPSGVTINRQALERMLTRQIEHAKDGRKHCKRMLAVIAPRTETNVKSILRNALMDQLDEYYEEIETAEKILDEMRKGDQ